MKFKWPVRAIGKTKNLLVDKIEGKPRTGGPAKV